MRILYVLPAIKHPTMRGELRHYHFLRMLGRRHAVTLLALSRSEVAPRAIDELRQYTEQIVVVDGAPRTATRPGVLSRVRARVAKIGRVNRALGEVRQTVRRIAQPDAFDVVLLHGHRIRAVVDGAHSLPLVFDMCDAAAPRLWQGLRHAPALEVPWRLFRYWQMRRMEIAARDRTSHIAFISARDRRAVMGDRPGGAIVPNGVDLEYWRPGDGARPERTLVFTGVLDYPPNADAALYLVTQVLPAVRRAMPDVEVVLAGRSPLPVLVQEAQRRSGITVTGFVNDLRPYLDRATVFVAPLRFASGMQNKLLEAMAMELPVVTTSIATDGLRVDGAEPPVRVGDSTDDLAAHVVSLLREAGARERLGVLGREYVSRHFDWQHSAQLLERMCFEAIACAPREPAHARKAGPLCSGTR